MQNVLILITLMLYSAVTAAFPEILPHDTTTQVNLTGIDRAALPVGNYTIYRNEIVTYEPNNKLQSGRTGMVCRSTSDSTNGKCPTDVIWDNQTLTTRITLRFTEKNSNLTRDLSLIGSRNTVYPSATGCTTYSRNYQLNSTYRQSCGSSVWPEGSSINLDFDQAELKNLPVGGIWTATLYLDAKKWDPVVKLATYTIKFTIDLTDKNNIQVWLPQFTSGTPQVDLNLKPVTAGGDWSRTRFVGKNVLDMCLYDGFNSNSTNMQMQFTGEGGSGAADAFFLKGDNGSQIPYGVNFAFQGDSVGKNVKNGEVWPVDNVAGLPIRSVNLPNVSAPVLCWPAALTLSADLPAKTAAGHYSGTLRVVFTPNITAI